MRAIDALPSSPTREKALCWTMRLTGLLLAIGSAFFLLKNLRLDATDDWFFTLSALLGAATFAASWFPARRQASLARRPHAAVLRQGG